MGRRQAFTIYEVLIALALASMLSIVLFQTMISSTRTSEKNLNTIGFLREASLLMEYIKQDIRNAPRETASIDGQNPQLISYDKDGRARTIRYRYDPQNRTVTRSGGPKDIVFGQGRSGSMGRIIRFEIKEIEDMGQEPFFQILLEFATPQQVEAEAAGRISPGGGSPNHKVHALVSRRVAGQADDKWKVGFPSGG